VTDDGDSGVRRAADRFGHVGDDRDAARRTVEHLAGVAAGQGVVDHHPDREPVTVANQAVGNLALRFGETTVGEDDGRQTVEGWLLP